MPTSWGRLSSAEDVRKVYALGGARGGRLMRLCYLAKDDHLPTRVAFVASKRVGGAVQRNRAKRLMREAWRADGRMRTGWDLVFVASSGAPDADLRQICGAMAALISRVEKSDRESHETAHDSAD